MADSLELLRAVQSIEAQLNIIKRALNDMGIKDEGVIGTFDGEFMILDSGRKFPIPPNYASKSMLVPGDTLRLIEDPNGGEQHKFKQIAKAERGKATGLLTRKDGKFEVICEEGSFKVLTAAVKHFEGEPGDQATIQFARNHTKGSWAAVEKVHKAGASTQTADSRRQTGENASSQTISSQSPETLQQFQSSAPSLQPPVQPISHAQPEAAPVQSSPASSQPIADHQSAPAAPKSNSANRSSSSSKSSKPKSSPSRSKPSSARPADSPARDLIPQQGEIAISSVMDDDDLA